MMNQSWGMKLIFFFLTFFFFFIITYKFQVSHYPSADTSQLTPLWIALIFLSTEYHCLSNVGLRFFYNKGGVFRHSPHTNFSQPSYWLPSVNTNSKHWHCYSGIMRMQYVIMKGTPMQHPFRIGHRLCSRAVNRRPPWHPNSSSTRIHDFSSEKKNPPFLHFMLYLEKGNNVPWKYFVISILIYSGFGDNFN